jgi:hypothetical protein
VRFNAPTTYVGQPLSPKLRKCSSGGHAGASVAPANQFRQLAEFAAPSAGLRRSRPNTSKQRAANAATGPSWPPRLRTPRQSGLQSRSANVDLLRPLVASGIDLVFCDLPHVPPGAMGRFLLTEMASVAELEAGLISERTKAALAAAKRHAALSLETRMVLAHCRVSRRATMKLLRTG